MHRWIKKEENEWECGWEEVEGRQRCWDEVKEGGRVRIKAGGGRVSADGRNCYSI